LAKKSPDDIFHHINYTCEVLNERYLCSVKIAMAKTLHSHGVSVPYIAVATGLTQRRIRAELKTAVKNHIKKHQA
jgi:hypothetical protein